MRLRTRGQLLERFAADRQERFTGTGTYTKEGARRQLDQSLAYMWQFLTDGESGFGQVYTKLTATAGSTLALPADFLSLHSLRRAGNNGVPMRTSWKEVIAKRFDEIGTTWGPIDGVAGYFLIEAPKVGTLASQQLRFFPDLSEGEQVTLVYVTQPPSLANSDGTYTDLLGDAEDDTIQIDMYDDTLIDGCVSLARARIANKADSKEYQLALQRAGDIAKTVVTSRNKQDEGPPMPLSAYRTSGRWGRI
jgi:hypothetical protein